MSAKRRLLDDIAKLATSTAGLVQGAGKEAENAFRHRMEALLDRMELVQRDEFDAVKEMAAKARSANSRLEKRITALEAQLAPAKKRASTKKAAAKKTAAKKVGAKKVGAKTSSSRKKPVAKKSAAKKPKSRK